MKDLDSKTYIEVAEPEGDIDQVTEGRQSSVWQCRDDNDDEDEPSLSI